MRGISIALFVGLLSQMALASEVLHEVEWNPSLVDGMGAGATLLEKNQLGFAPVRVENKSGQSLSVILMTIENPKISKALYCLRGRVSYSGVEGKAYFELWNHFPGDLKFFSKTLADAGPVGHLQGSSDWRQFVLPFSNKPGGQPPEKLVLRLVLPASGQVTVGPLALVQFEAGENPLVFDISGQWFSAGAAGWLGGVFGALLGLLGGLIGFLSSRARARAFVLGSLQTLMVLGLVSLGVGVWALVNGQSQTVYSTMLLCGGLSLVIPLGLYRQVAGRYRSAELRKLSAQDVA